MLSKRQFAQKFENRRKSTVSVGIVFLMITSTWLGLISTLNQEYEVETTEEAHLWLEKKFAQGQQREYREARVIQLLDRELLPHLGDQVEDRKKKAIFLGRIVRQVLEMAITDRKPNDKDHYANKRVRLAGDLFEDLFRVFALNIFSTFLWIDFSPVDFSYTASSIFTITGIPSFSPIDTAAFGAI